MTEQDAVDRVKAVDPNWCLFPWLERSGSFDDMLDQAPWAQGSMADRVDEFCKRNGLKSWRDSHGLIDRDFDTKQWRIAVAHSE